MSAALNNVTAPDEYTPAATLFCPKTVRVRLQVNNQAIYWQRGVQQPGGGVEFPASAPEEFQPPGAVVFEEECDLIRVRAAIPAASLPLGIKQAQVTIATRTQVDLPVSAF